MISVNVRLGGGLGNKLFVYAFARAYAERYGFELHVDGCYPHLPWQRIFSGIDHPSIERELPARESFKLEEWEGDGDIMITGYCQHQKNLIYTRHQVREWFQLKPEMLELVKAVPAMEIIANLRLGEYCYACNPFIWIDWRAYIDCCGYYGLPTQTLYFQDGNEHYRIPEIPIEKPWVELTGEERERSIDYLPDLALLMRTKILLRSNSTFAWWAATLGNNQRVFCPDVAKVNAADGIINGHRVQQWVPFVEGNHTPMVTGWEYLSDLHLKEA